MLLRHRLEPSAAEQVDSAALARPWGRRHALVTVLKHARMSWLRVYRRQTMEVLLESLETELRLDLLVFSALPVDAHRSRTKDWGETGSGPPDMTVGGRSDSTCWP